MLIVYDCIHVLRQLLLLGQLKVLMFATEWMLRPLAISHRRYSVILSCLKQYIDEEKIHKFAHENGGWVGINQ